MPVDPWNSPTPSGVGAQKIFVEHKLSFTKKQIIPDRLAQPGSFSLGLWLQIWGFSRRESWGAPLSLLPVGPCPTFGACTHRAALGEVVMGTAQEVRPATLPLHNGTGASGGLAEGAAGQLHPVVLAFGHVHSTQQGLDHCPAAGCVPEAWGEATVWIRCGEAPPHSSPQLFPRPKAGLSAIMLESSGTVFLNRAFGQDDPLCCRAVRCIAGHLASLDSAH